VFGIWHDQIPEHSIIEVQGDLYAIKGKKCSLFGMAEYPNTTIEKWVKLVHFGIGNVEIFNHAKYLNVPNIQYPIKIFVNDIFKYST